MRDIIIKKKKLTHIFLAGDTFLRCTMKEKTRQNVYNNRLVYGDNYSYYYVDLNNNNKSVFPGSTITRYGTKYTQFAYPVYYYSLTY